MIGIDFSMNSPAVVIGNSESIYDLDILCFRQRKRDKSNLSNIIIKDIGKFDSSEERYYVIATTILEFIKSKTNDKIVYIEDYSYSSTGTIFNIAECTGILKMLLWKNGFTINKIAPKTVKKFACLDGNAGKPKMYEAFLNKTNFNFNKYFTGFTKDIEIGDKKIPSPISDIIDAYFILQYALSEREE